jgi:hypothetical protein
MKEEMLPSSDGDSVTDKKVGHDRIIIIIIIIVHQPC